MIYAMLADAVVIVHAAFVIFALFGGFLILRWRLLAWLHIPAVLWAALVEITGWFCPLTPFENLLRQRAGKITYRSDFIDHYIMPALYPDALTHELQIILGLSVLFINLLIYAWIWHRSKKASHAS